MSEWLVGVISVVYLVVSAGYVKDMMYGWALVYFAYALANVGLILASINTRA